MYPMVPLPESPLVVPGGGHFWFEMDDKLEFEGLFLNRRSRRAGACPRRTGLLNVGRQGQAPALQGYDFDENRLFSQHFAGGRKGRPYKSTEGVP